MAKDTKAEAADMRPFVSTPLVPCGKPLNSLARILAFTLIFSLALPAIAIRAEKIILPAGFIALSEFPMTGNEAKAFCARHGGRLPRVNGSDYLAWLEIAAETPIEGFGAQSASWPSGLPGSAYWTGTGGLAANPDHLWILINDNGRVAVFNPYPGWTHRALCVP